MKFIFGTFVHWGSKNSSLMLLIRKPYFHGNKNIHEYFVFSIQLKLIFGTLGKRKSINYVVVMKPYYLVTVWVMFLFAVFVP